MTVVRKLSPWLLIAAALAMPAAGLHAQPASNAPPSAKPAAAAPANAQPASSGPPNAVQGFSQNRDQPVHIESLRLEVHDKDNLAIFSGNVRVTQGDTVMRCKALYVFYEQNTEGGDTGAKNDNADKSKPSPAVAPAPASQQTTQAATPAPGGQQTTQAATPESGSQQQSIKRMEAHGSVVVTQKDQVATGDLGIFEVKTNIVTLIGNVTMTQGQNVIRGEKLTVDLNTNVSHVEPAKTSGGRVQGLLFPQNAGPDAAKPGAAPNTGQAPQPATAPASNAAPAAATAPVPSSN
jgi:lipopolysaccharide export system protein LptA